MKKKEKTKKKLDINVKEVDVKIIFNIQQAHPRRGVSLCVSLFLFSLISL